MTKIINAFFGFFIGLFPLVLVSIIVFFFYIYQPNWIGITVGALLTFGALWIGVKIFIGVYREGGAYFAHVGASSDMDTPEQYKGSDFRLITAQDLAHPSDEPLRLFKGGAPQFFGDHFESHFKHRITLTKAEFLDQENQLVLYFAGGERLTIWDPVKIYDSGTYLKILHATQIRFEWHHQPKKKAEKKVYYLHYKQQGKKIVGTSNVDYFRPIFDVSAGAPALMIYS